MRLITSILVTVCLCLAPSAKAYQNAFKSPADKKIRLVELNGRNTITLSTSITGLTANVFMTALVGKRILLDPSETMYVVIDSGGGQYRASLQILEMLKTLPNTQVLCRYCASAAGMLYTSSGLHRLAIPQSKMLMHEMYIDHVTADTISNPNIRMSLEVSSDEFNQRIYSVIGITKEEYEDKIRGSEWIVIGMNLIKLHLADELVTVKCDEYTSGLIPDTCE